MEDITELLPETSLIFYRIHWHGEK